LLPAYREIRQGGTPSLRRLSTQPRTFPRAPLLTTTTGRHNVAHVRASPETLARQGHRALPLPHTSFVVHAAITPQTVHDPGQPPGERHYCYPLATTGCDALCPVPQLAPHDLLAAQ